MIGSVIMPPLIVKFNLWIKDNENKWISAGVIAILCASVMPFAIYFVSNSSLTADSFSKLGTVGDFLGGTTVGLLSLSSILFLISTIVMQRKELGLQREELQLTRVELAKANEQYRITNETMLKQQFETTFFNMINMHNNLVEGLTLYNQEIKGRDVFISLFDFIEAYYKKDMMDFYFKNLIRSCETLDQLETLINNYYDCLKMKDSKKEYNLEKFYMNKELPDIWRKLRNYDDATEIEIGNILKLNFDDFRLIIDMYKFDGDYERAQINNNELLKSIELNFIESKHYKQTSYLTVCNNFRYPLSSYYKSIHGIIHFVESAKLNVNEKTKYLEMFSSLFGTFEITLLYYEIHLGENEQLNYDLAFVPSLGLIHGYLDTIL